MIFGQEKECEMFYIVFDCLLLGNSKGGELYIVSFIYGRRGLFIAIQDHQLRLRKSITFARGLF